MSTPRKRSDGLSGRVPGAAWTSREARISASPQAGRAAAGV